LTELTPFSAALLSAYVGLGIHPLLSPLGGWARRVGPFRPKNNRLVYS
jgi:hypothetical protein